MADATAPLARTMTPMPPTPVLFVQGGGDMRHPEGSGHLADYLTRELGSAYRVVAPEMPDADDPQYEPWRDKVEQELAELGDRVVLVGHSFGGTVLMKYLAEGADLAPISGLFLVSVPDFGPDGWTYEPFALPTGWAATLSGTKVFLYHSEDDPEVPFDHHRRFAAALPDATARPIPGSEHSFVKGLPPLIADIKGLSS